MHRFISFLMMLSAGAILVIAHRRSRAFRVSRRSNWLWGVLERNPWFVWLTHVTADYGATALLIGCVALLFYFIPNTEMRFRYVWPGAIVTGLLWRAALSAFSWYARDLAAWNVIHGSIAAVVIFLLWIYVSAVILLYGVEMTAAYARLRAAAVSIRPLRPAGPQPPRHLSRRQRPEGQFTEFRAIAVLQRSVSMGQAPHESSRRRAEPVSSAARAQPGRLVSVGRRRVRARARRRTSRSFCRSAIRRATGVTSWSASRSRARRLPRS